MLLHFAADLILVLKLVPNSEETAPARGSNRDRLLGRAIGGVAPLHKSRTEDRS
jgi:hypothetical protein